MGDTFRAVLAIHILCGGVALFVAPGAMLARKGGAWHRRWGKVYFWAMAAVAANAMARSCRRVRSKRVMQASCGMRLSTRAGESS